MEGTIFVVVAYSTTDCREDIGDIADITNRISQTLADPPTKVYGP